MMTLKKRRFLLVLCFLAFLIMAAGTLCYSRGYILDSKFNFSKRGGLYIATPLGDSEIYINNKKEKATGMLNRGLFKSGLKNDYYSILVAKENYWPWAKTLEVKKGLVAEARAFMITKNPEGEILLKGKFSNLWSLPGEKILILEEEGVQKTLSFYSPGEKTFLTEHVLVPKELETFEKYTNRKDQRLWWDPQTNELFVEWLKKDTPPPYYICEDKNDCQMPIRIFHSHLAIKNADFFPGRKDIAIIAIDNGIYALELDGRDDRLIYPIYKGKNPTFTLLSGEENIYINDSGSLIKIYLK